ncbi:MULTISPECIES: site-specific integrase [unclassified Iodidimonas]|jgi:integrase|uniref:tyrosine-type recombinase/integrase n=1 Tax=unclassified Iodidimonas TaxID=2626145 RepID=UPI002482B1EA|nr:MULTISPECIES: site-specific integrase [unclassified Iodidimonas]
MTQVRLTKTVVDKLEPRDKDYFVWCGKLAGFGVRVWKSGRKTFVVQYRAGGRDTPSRRKSLGVFGTVTTEEARKVAESYLASAQLGNDRIGDDQRARSELTVNQLCADYIKHGVTTKKESTIKTDMGRITSHICPLIGKKKISAVTRRDVEQMLQDIAAGKTARDSRTEKGRSIIKGGKGTATRTVRLLGGIFTYAINHGLLEANPCAGVKVFKDGSKERFLSQAELDSLAKSLEDAETIGLPWLLRDEAQTKHRPKDANMREVMSPHVTGAIRLLVLTGCRLREILHLRWTEVDLERGLLNLPDSKTGRKTVYLSNAAIDVLAKLPRAGTYVVAGDDPQKPRSDLKRPWKRISNHAGISDVRIHDLRHTFASIGAAQGLSLQLIGKLLGHKSPETTARYAHLTEDPLRRALNDMSSSIPFGQAPKAQ